MAMRPPSGGGGLMGAIQSRVGKGPGPGAGAPPPPMPGAPDAEDSAEGPTSMADEALMQDFLKNPNPDPTDLINVVKALIRDDIADDKSEGPAAPPAPPPLGGGAGGLGGLPGL